MNAPRIHTAAETTARREAEIARNVAARGGTVAPGERRWSITPTEGAPLLVTTDRICPSDPCWIARLSPAGTDTAIGESEREAVVTLAGRLGYVGAIVAPVVDDSAVATEINDLRASLGGAIVDRDIAEKSSDALRAELAAAHAHIAVLERTVRNTAGRVDDIGEELHEAHARIAALTFPDDLRVTRLVVDVTVDPLFVMRAVDTARRLFRVMRYRCGDELIGVDLSTVNAVLDGVESAARYRIAAGVR